MDEILYDACYRYFTTLAHYGYRPEEDLKKLLLFIYIHELVNNTSIIIPKEDYQEIENALYCIYGTTCLIPYPNYCEKAMSLHLGDVAELVSRVANTEQDVEDILALDLDGRIIGLDGRVTTNEGDIEDIQELDLDNRVNALGDRVTTTENDIDTIEGQNLDSRLATVEYAIETAGDGDPVHTMQLAIRVANLEDAVDVLENTDFVVEGEDTGTVN